MLDQDLVQRLYPRANWYPWRAFASGSKIVHAPGLHGHPDPLPDGYPVHGYRGICVKDYRQPPAAVLLCWAGVDVDAEDNVGTDVVTKCVETVGAECIVRTSKSGRGAHNILVLKTPIELDYAAAAETAKNIIRPFVHRLNQAGVNTCVSGLPNLWLWSEGGLQRTEVDVGYLHDEPTPVATRINQAFPVVGAADVPVALFSGTAGSALHQLVVHGVVASRNGHVCRKQNINIGAVKRALAGLIDLKTKSKCRPEHSHNVNGFIEFNVDGDIKVFSNPDQAAILVLHSL